MDPAPEPLGHFTVCPRCATPAPPIRSGPFRCARCGLVLFFNAASAVAVFVVRADGRVLFTRRAKDPGRDRLGLPGGFVDFGETAEEALRREVREEVGLELGSLAYVASYPNVYVYAGVTYHTLDIFFEATPAGADEPRPLDAVASVTWLDPAEVHLGEIAFESMRRGLVAFRRRGKRTPEPEAGA